jgi:hypothetical protein
MRQTGWSITGFEEDRIQGTAGLFPPLDARQQFSCFLKWPRAGGNGSVAAWAGCHGNLVCGVVADATGLMPENESNRELFPV